MSKMAKLEVRNLTISFRTNNGAVRAVRDISFDLNEGETLAIAGILAVGILIVSTLFRFISMQQRKKTK